MYILIIITNKEVEIFRFKLNKEIQILQLL